MKFTDMWAEYGNTYSDSIYPVDNKELEQNFAISKPSTTLIVNKIEHLRNMHTNIKTKKIKFKDK